MKIATLLAVLVIVCGSLVIASREFSFHSSDSTIAPWTFSNQTSLNYLYYAITTYCPHDQIESWTCEYCSLPSQKDFRFYKFYNNIETGTFGYLGYHPVNQTIYVVFRGSVNVRNWIVDFLFPKKSVFKNYTGVEVAEGFLDAYEDLAPKVKRDVHKLITDKNYCYNCQVVVTGHSLGGALATLGAADLADEGYNVSSYTFGSPRVGNYNFSRLYGKLVPNTFRLVNNRDIVPTVPLVEMGFWHVTTEVWEHGTNNDVYTTCSNTTGEDPTCSDSVISISTYDHVHYMNINCGCNSTTSEDALAFAQQALKARQRRQ